MAESTVTLAEIVKKFGRSLLADSLSDAILPPVDWDTWPWGEEYAWKYRLYISGKHILMRPRAGAYGETTEFQTWYGKVLPTKQNGKPSDKRFARLQYLDRRCGHLLSLQDHPQSLRRSRLRCHLLKYQN